MSRQRNAEITDYFTGKFWIMLSVPYRQMQETS